MSSDEILLTDDNIAPMQEELFRLYSQGFLTDITLSCEDGKNFEAHRVLLAARSQYFYGIVPKLKVEPVIFLKGVKGSHLEKILKFIYSGSATVSRSQLRPILEVAKSLQIRGLQELAPTELSRGTNTSVSCSTKYGGGGSKTSSPVPPKKESEQCFRSSPSSQSARDRDIAVQQQQKLYDKLTSAKKSPCKPGHSHGDKHSPSYKSSSHKRGSRPSNVKIPSTKSLKAEENGEETFKFQYQYISDDSEEIDKDDSNDSDFELAAKRNQNQLQAKGSPLKKKRGRPPKNHVATDMSGSRKKYEKEESEDEDVYDTNIGTASKSSSDDDTDNSSDELDNDQDLDNDSSDSDSDNESEDQSDDEESGHGFPQPASPKAGSIKQTSPKKAPEPSKVKREEGPSGSAEEFYDSPPAPPRRSGGSGRGPMINGKHILPVQCKGKRAELHLSKFGNGTNGKSIKYKGDWMTPEAYEQACGSKTRKYLESITTDYGPLKTLTASGLLKPHPKKCKCSACSDEVLTSSPEKSPKKEEKREGSKKETVKSEVPTFNKHTESEKPKHRKREPSIDMDDPDGDKEVKKRKKESERSESRPKPPFSSTPSQPSPSLSTSQSSQSKSTELTSSHRHSSPKPHFSKHHSRTDPSTASKASPPITCSPSKLASPSIHKSEIIAPPTLTTTKPVLTSPATCTASVSSHSSFSPSTTKPLASPSFIALSPATSMNPLPPIQSSLTSSVVPFPSKLSGIPSTGSPSLSSLPSYSQPSPLPSPLTTATTTPVSITTTSPTTTTSFGQVKVENKNSVSKQQIAIQMGPPKPGDFSSGPAAVSGVQQQQQQVQQHHQQQQQQGPGSLQHKGGGRVGSVMQVRCKSVPALLYVAKYESGSKGKCILVGDEWMTPNEYEEKSGSKAKKYLSSIKCLGRPLRAYVNSGELRGTGPPPSPKPPKMNKPKPPQLIAPAPSPGQGLSMGSTLGMAPPGMSPAHMPGTLPQSLTQVAMMSGVSVGQPIILNQSNLANSMHNQMLAPMTLTFAPMTTAGMGQQQQQPTQQQQQHHLQQHQMHHQQQQQQQLHGSGEYILQHK